MPYFHAIALFEARGSSLEEMDRAALSLLTSLSHQRVRYYEHETIGGIGPHGPIGTALHFTIFADFDVEAQTEERAAELVEDILDALSTDDIQYFAHGLALGEQRVLHARQTSSETGREAERETHPERGGRRGGRRRGARGRGKGGGGAQEIEAASVETIQDISPRPPEGEPAEVPVAAQAATPSVSTREDETAGGDVEERELSLPPVEAVELDTPPVPPPRSSPSMHVTLTVTLHASELVRPTNGSASLDQEELIVLATTEARRRYPELPAHIAPEPVLAPLPWGDTVLTLTWHYDVPVPSAGDRE